MLSHFLNSTITFLTRSRTPANPRSDPEAEQQLQDELATAVSENMFSTRSQEHALPSTDEQGRSINGLPPASKRKRKAERSSDTTPIEGATKRRRKESVTEATSSVEDSVDGSASIPSPQLVQPASNIDESQNEGISGRATSRSAETSPRVLPPTAATSSAVTPKALDTQSKNGKVTKERRNPQSLDPANATPTTESTPNPPKAAHKKYGNEDLNPPKTVPSSTKIEDSPIFAPLRDHVEAENEENSSDEAPETVTASAGLNQARAAVSEAAKVAKRQAAVEKQKRKTRDARLKDQAKSSKKHRKNPIDEPSDTQSTTSDNPTPATKNPTKPLPTLLPHTLLSAPAAPRLPTPPPIPQPPNQSSLARKLKRQDAASKPVKDVTRGPVRVRVLEKENVMLPPKVERRSMEVREGWLKGRGAVVRRELGGGFVRGS